MINEQGYRRIRIKCTQQVLDVPIPVAAARVNGGTAEYVDEDKPEVKKDPDAAKVETAAVTPNVERAMKPQAQSRTAVHPR